MLNGPQIYKVIIVAPQISGRRHYFRVGPLKLLVFRNQPGWVTSFHLLNVELLRVCVHMPILADEVPVLFAAAGLEAVFCHVHFQFLLLYLSRECQVGLFLKREVAILCP